MKDPKDFTGPRPSVDDLRRMWERIEIRACPFDPVPFAPCMEAFREIYANGGALLYCFTISEDSVFDWFPIGRDTLYLDIRAKREQELDFFARFLGSPAVRAEAKELKIPDPLRLLETEKEMTFALGSPLSFEGNLAQVLYQGGAYGAGFRGRAVQARDLARNFKTPLFGDRYEEVLIYHTSKPWCPWFCDIAWDSTSIIFDKRSRRIWLLCCTDTD